MEGQYRETRYEWDKAIHIYRSLFALHPERVEYGLRLAHTDTLAGNPAMAFETIRRLRELQLPASAEEETDLAEAETAAAISDFSRQQGCAARAAVNARRSGNTLLLARAEVLEGEAKRSLGDYENALSRFEDAKTIFASYGDQSSIVAILVDEGRLYRQKGDLARAEELLQEAITSSRRFGDLASLGRALTALGEFKMFQVGGAFGRAISKQAVDIFRSIGDKKDEAYALSLVADTHFTYQRAEAKQFYERSLGLSREVNDRSRVAGRLMDLGIIATLDCDFDVAERNFREALQIYRETGEHNRAALQLKHLANVYMWRGRLADAANMDQHAIALLPSDIDANIRGEIRQHLADVQREAGELIQAENSLHLAINEHRQANDYGYVKLAEMHLAEILAMEGKYQESRAALGEFDQLVPWSIPAGARETLGVLILARLDFANGKTGEALRKVRRAVVQWLAINDQGSAMRARLLLGELEIASGDAIAGQRELRKLEQEAAAKGLGLIQSRAQRLLGAQTAQLSDKSVLAENATRGKHEGQRAHLLDLEGRLPQELRLRQVRALKPGNRLLLQGLDKGVYDRFETGHVHGRTWK